jgi:hypothetical protein
LSHFYRFFGEIFLYFSVFSFAVAKSFGLKIFLVDTGYFLTILDLLIGRSTKLPEQLGQTFSKRVTAQVLQYVHSKVQIIASVELLGKPLLQCSQLGLISSIISIALL